MDLALQSFFNDQTLRSNTVQVLKKFESQSLATQAKEREQLGSMMAAIEKKFDSMGDDIVELSRENEKKNKIWSYDEKWLEEFEAKLLKQVGDEKLTFLILSRKRKQMKKTVINDVHMLI